MPAIGLYERSYGLHEVLMEDFWILSQNDLVYELIFTKIQNIVNDLYEGRNSEFVARRRFLNHMQELEEEYGIPRDWIAWNGKDTGYDFFAEDFFGESQWEIYFDGQDAFEAADKILQGGVDPDPYELALELSILPHVPFVGLLTIESGWFYVLKSRTQGFGQAMSPADHLHFACLSPELLLVNAEEEGDEACFLLDHETIKSVIEAEEINNECIRRMVCAR